MNQKLSILIICDVFLNLFFGPKIWSLLPENFKIIDSLENFKILIKEWKPVKLPLKAMQGLHKNMGFLCNKKLCIISQDNVLITKFNIFRFPFFSYLICSFNCVVVGESLMCLTNTATAVILFGLYDLLLPQDSTG